MAHIVLITTSYPISNDGSEAAGSFVADFSKELSNHTKVTVIAPGNNTTDPESISNNITIVRFKVPKLPLSLLKPYNPMNWLSILKTLKSGARALEQVLEDTHIDHIFALWTLPSGYWARNIGYRKFKIPYSTWSLGSDIWSLGKIPIIRTILKNVLLASQSNFADGYLLRDTIQSITKRDCIFLPSTRAVNITSRKQLSTSPPFRLAYLGRWHANKGIDLLLDSLILLREEDWQHIKEIQICGGGPMNDIVRNSAKNLSNRPITIRGYLDKAEATKLFEWADYVLIPSRIESIPVVFSDAMKCACPVVCMPVGDLPYLINKYNIGILANQVTAESFSKAISRILLEHPDSYSAKLDQVANVFRLEYIVDNFMKIILSEEDGR